MPQRSILLFCVLLLLSLPIVACDGAGKTDTGERDPLDSDTDNEPTTDGWARVYDATVIHEIELQVPQDTLDTWALPSKEPEDDYSSCDVLFDGIPVEGAGVRRKGHSTFQSAEDGRWSFVLSFDAFVDGQTLLGLKKVVLNNSVFDPTFMNEPLGYGLYTRLGLPAPATSHAVVRLNGDLLGLYVLKEPINKQFLARTFGEGNDEANLYEGPGDLCPIAPGMPFELPALEDEDEGRTNEDLQELVTRLGALDDGALDDGAFLDGASKLLDMSGFMLGRAVDSSAIHFDAYPVNYYLYHEPVSQLFVFIPHGMDQLFRVTDTSGCDPGMPKDCGVMVWAPDYDPRGFETGGCISMRTIHSEEGSARFGEALAELSEVGWELEAMKEQVESFRASLRDLAPYEGRLATDLPAVETALGELDAFLEARDAWLERTLEHGPQGPQDPRFSMRRHAGHSTIPPETSEEPSAR